MASEQKPASDLIEQAADKIEGIYSGRYTLGTDLSYALRGELGALIIQVRQQEEQERETMRGLLEQASTDESPLVAAIPANVSGMAALHLLQSIRNWLEAHPANT